LWISRLVVPKLVQHARLLSQNNPLVGAAAINKSTEEEALRQSQAQAPSLEQLQNRFNLTRRELQIVKALHDAMTNKEIATQFGISEYTVKHHLTKIFDKVGVYNRLELVMFATHHGLVSPASPNVTGLLAS
jgi:DNA-binding NarL/FixJ family response regulator